MTEISKPMQIAADLMRGRGIDGALTYAEEMVKTVEIYEHKVTWMQVRQRVIEAKTLGTLDTVEIMAAPGADPSSLSSEARCPCCRGTQWCHSMSGPVMCSYCAGTGRVVIVPRSSA